MVLYQVPETERALREQMRKKLAWLGFGPMSASVWVSPHDRTAAIRDEFGGHETVSLDVLHARSDGAAHDRDIALRCWDLAALDHDYAQLLKQYEPRLTRYRTGEYSGRDALTERMLLIHDYRMFPFRDPDLPLELLPGAWSGREAHEVFLEAHESLRGPAEAYVDDVLAGQAQRLRKRGL